MSTPGAVVGRAAAALSLLMVCTQAFGSLGAHYAGTSANGAEVQLYLDGGKFLGQQGGVHILQTDIRIQRNGRAVQTVDRCRYIYNPANHAHNRIECDDTARGQLRGVVYTLDQKLFKESGGETQQMRCVQRCSRLVPKVLALDVEEDNG